MTEPKTQKARAMPALSVEPMVRRLLADSGGAVVLLFLDNAGRLAAQVAQVIQLGATHLAAADHLDRVDHRGEDREHALHALAVRDLAHGEALIDAAAGTADTHALI